MNRLITRYRSSQPNNTAITDITDYYIEAEVDPVETILDQLRSRNLILAGTYVSNVMFELSNDGDLIFYLVNTTVDQIINIIDQLGAIPISIDGDYLQLDIDNIGIVDLKLVSHTCLQDIIDDNDRIDSRILVTTGSCAFSTERALHQLINGIVNDGRGRDTGNRQQLQIESIDQLRHIIDRIYRKYGLSIISTTA